VRRRTSRAGRTQTPLGGPGFRELVRSVFHRRGLLEGPIPAERFEQILECARWAPSVANQQPWLLAAASGSSAREFLDALNASAVAFEDPFSPVSRPDVRSDLRAAGAVVVLMGHRASPFWRESLLLATYQLMLGVTAQSLAARALLPVSPNDMVRFLKVPEDYVVYSLVLVGHAGEAEANTQLLKPILEVSAPLRLLPPAGP
jgi:nitroreductase